MWPIGFESQIVKVDVHELSIREHDLPYWWRPLRKQMRMTTCVVMQ